MLGNTRGATIYQTDLIAQMFPVVQIFLMKCLRVTDLHKLQYLLHKRLTNPTTYDISSVYTVKTVDSRDEILLVLSLLC